jgi:8-oxo-dGTP pyrophosphatase MutT (NUDIX family)
MAHFKRLTDTDDKSVFVNLENIAFLQREDDLSTIVFVGGRSDEGRILATAVRETPEEVLMKDMTVQVR